VVAGFARQENWRASSNDYETAAAAANAKARTITDNAAIEQQRALDRHRADMNKISQQRGTLAENEVAILDLERDLAEAENRLTVEQGQVTGMSSENRLLLAAYNSEMEHSAKLAKRNAELERRNVDLNDRVKELTVNVTMATARIRALQQQIAAMEGRDGVETYAQTGGIVEANLPTVHTPATPMITAPIRGRITSIDGNLASVSVGSADGVAPGMTFLIYRRADGRPLYLGSLRITRVEANESAGIIEQSVGDIRVGDTARDELSFARRG
jgi:hypothetical protein